MRATFAECRSVSAYRQVSSETAHTGVATPVPSRLKLVMLRYRPGNCASRSAGRDWTKRSLGIGTAVVALMRAFLPSLLEEGSLGRALGSSVRLTGLRP